MPSRVTPPNNVLSRSLDAKLGRSTVLPPQDAARMEQYEENFGGVESPVEATQAPPAEGIVSPTQPLSAPPPLAGFVAIDLTRMVVIGDNYEEFPIEAEQTQLALKVLCRDMYLNTLNTRLVEISESLGVPLPEPPKPDTSDDYLQDEPSIIRKRPTRKKRKKA